MQGWGFRVATGAYSAAATGVSRRLSEEPVGGRDGTITSRSAYWLGPYLLYMLPSASSITNTVAPSSAPAESSPADRLGGALTATGTAAAPAQNGTTHTFRVDTIFTVSITLARKCVAQNKKKKNVYELRERTNRNKYDWSAAATRNVRIAFLRQSPLT